MKKIFLIAFLIIIRLIIPSPTFAHPVGLASIDAVIKDKALTAKFKFPDKVFTVDPKEVLDFFGPNFKVSQNGTPCKAAIEKFTPPKDSATFVFTCSDKINKLKVHSDLPQNFGYTYSASFKKDDLVKNYTFDTENNVFEAEFSADALLKDLAKHIFDFIKLGTTHIYTGYDHILFLLATILVISGLGRLIKVVTAFTIAHSATLIISSLGLITLTSKIVEPIIALSIAYVAFENLFAKKDSPIFQRRWLIAFGFGLIHGLGFAGALKEVNIPQNELLLDLVSFNVGIELAQLTIIAIALPIFYLMNRYNWRNKVIFALSFTIGAIGLFWFLERLMILI